jgi:Uma2 family endonuclease
MPSTELSSLSPGAATAAAAPPVVAAAAPVVDMCPYPPTDLPYDDGEPLESNWHGLQIGLLIDLIHSHRRGERDFFAGGNMFVYYSREQIRTQDYRGPDFFLVNHVPHKPDRPYWAIWDEGGRYPDLIVELLSPKTKQIDLTTKFQIYEKIFATHEYVAYDPETREIKAWRKGEDGKFHLIEPNEKGRYLLMTAHLSLGTWFGTRYNCESTWLRFFDSEGNLVPTTGEGAWLRADAEEARADALAAELARLKAELANPT